MLSSPKPFTTSAQLPFLVSYKSQFREKPRLSAKAHFSLSSIQSERTQFLGQSLGFQEKITFLDSFRKTHLSFHPVRAAVKKIKELPFDNVIQREKKLKLVLKIRKILVSQPERLMSIKHLGKFRKYLRIPKNRKLISLLRRFPAVFEIVAEGVYSLKFKMTPEAERIYLEELKYKNEMEDLLVLRLRKLLMMSMDKRILTEKIAHLRADLGLPEEFRDTICHRYPQYFVVVRTERGPALELTHWDPELAVSAAELSEEENRMRELEEQNLIIDRPPKFKRVRLPKGLQLSKSDMKRIYQFRDRPYISPYADFSDLKPGTQDKEKHGCGVVHEILSLTLEKRTLVDTLTHFREEFRFSQQLRGMLIRHPDMFYVSLKGDRDSVFLREAYHDSQLKDKDKLMLLKEKLRALVAVPRYPKRGSPKPDNVGAGKTEEEDDQCEGEETEEQSDENFTISDEFDDSGDDEYEDDWSDEDDDLPPDFDEDDDGTVNLDFDKPIKEKDKFTKNEEKVLEPVYPDGRPRERW